MDSSTVSPTSASAFSFCASASGISVAGLYATPSSTTSRPTNTVAFPEFISRIARTFISRSPWSFRHAAAIAICTMSSTVSSGSPFSSAITCTIAASCFKSKLSILLSFLLSPTN